MSAKDNFFLSWRQIHYWNLSQDAFQASLKPLIILTCDSPPKVEHLPMFHERRGEAQRLAGPNIGGRVRLFIDGNFQSFHRAKA